jgi:type VI secretion system protein ImpH
MGAEVGTPAAGMTDEEQTPAAQVLNALIAAEMKEDPCSFEFFQAVALLERLRDNKRPVGWFSNPEDEAVRFRANPHLGFPASEIQQLELKDKGPAEMMVNFMGLTGPQGVLPHPYSELILERMRAKDHSLAAFLDLFNHRAVSLFYRAWQRTRFQVNYGAGARDLFSRYLLDFLGLGTHGLRDRQDIEDEALMHYISLIGMQSRSATALEQVLADYFEVPVEVQQFTGAWYALDRKTQCAMTEKDSSSTRVGSGAVVGDAVWERQGRARIRIGPLSLQKYQEFLPGGSAHKGLRAITRFFANDCVDFEAQLVLERSQVPPIELNLDGITGDGKDERQAARLGWVSWAKTAPLGLDPDDTILAL